MSRPSARSRLLIVIPAQNEEEALSDVLRMVKAEEPSFTGIPVVPGGSTGATADIARAAGVTVLDLPLDPGVGGAMRAGLQYTRRVGYEYTYQLDADGRHDPREIETLIETTSSKHADAVIGSRFAGKGNYHARGPRKWAVDLFPFILSRVCETRLSDTTSGFKLYGPRVFSLFARNYPVEHLGDTTDALVIAVRLHLVTRGAGVQMHPRAGSEPFHNSVKSTLSLVQAMMAFAVSLSRPGEKVTLVPEESA